MPIYEYICTKCHQPAEVYMKMSDTAEQYCECGYAMRRVPSVPHTDLREYTTPIEMHSVACNTMEEVRQIQRECPDVQIVDDEDHPDFGVPIARTRKQKLAVLKAVGYKENN